MISASIFSRWTASCLASRAASFLTAGCSWCSVAPGLQGHEVLELVAPGHEGTARAASLSLGGVSLAGCIDGPEGAQDRSVERVGLGQPALGTREGTHPGGVVHAGGLLGRLQGSHDGAFVAAGALADDVGWSARFSPGNGAGP